MTEPRDLHGADQPVDVFISYTPADERWAVWIAWSLEAAGFATMVQAWDYLPGTNYLEFVDRGVRSAKVVLPVLSHTYLTSRYVRLEWLAALHMTVDGASPRALPVLVEESAADIAVAGLDTVDLIRVQTEHEALGRLLSRVMQVFAELPGNRLRVGGAQVRLSSELPGSGRDWPVTSGDDLLRTGSRSRRLPTNAPAFPPTGTAERSPETP